MNVTIMIPRPMQPACEGRSKIELGVPPASDVGDVIQTLIALYPGLRAWMHHDGKPSRHFCVSWSGRTLFLFASSSTTRAAS